MAADPKTGHWDSVADRWWQWRDIMGAASQPVSDHMVTMAGLAPGGRVLDVASGYGEPAATAARAVGERGRVISTDLSREMSRRAARWATEPGHGAMRVVRMDGAAPAFGGRSFDAVLCRWGLMALADRLALALAGFHRLLVPGGRLVAAVWGPPEQVPGIAVPLAAARSVLGKPAPAAGEGPFRLCDGEALREALESAGLEGVVVESVPVRYRFKSARAMTEFCRATSSPIRSLLADQPEERHVQVWDAVADAAAGMAGSGPEIFIQNAALCVCGARPV